MLRKLHVRPAAAVNLISSQTLLSICNLIFVIFLLLNCLLIVFPYFDLNSSAFCLTLFTGTVGPPSLRAFIQCLLQGERRCVKPLFSKSLLQHFPIGTWPLPFCYWCHRMGTKGAQQKYPHGLTSHSPRRTLSLSPEEAKLLIPGLVKAWVGWISTNKHSTHKQTIQK